MGSSDDDFPDIGELVKGARKTVVGTCKQASQRVTGSTKITAPSRERAGIKNEGEESLSGKSTTKPKKRVLKQKAENPLLRPITNSRTSSTTTASEVAMRRPKNSTFVEEKEVLERPRRKEKERVVIEVSESEEDDLGGFIVSDDCVDSTFCEEGVGIEDLEDESFVEKQREPPRSVRRLVRGRRERTPDEELEKTKDLPALNCKTEKRELDLEFGMRNLGLGSKEDKFGKIRGITKEDSENARPLKPKPTKVKSERSIETKPVLRQPFFILDSKDESELELERTMRTLDISMGSREGEKSRSSNDKPRRAESGKPKPTMEGSKLKKKQTPNSDTDNPFTLQ